MKREDRAEDRDSVRLHWEGVRLVEMSLKWLLLEFAKRGVSRAVRICIVVAVVCLVIAE